MRNSFSPIGTKKGKLKVTVTLKKGDSETIDSDTKHGRKKTRGTRLVPGTARDAFSSVFDTLRI